jgi:uncharacterized membrane protein
MLVLLTVIALPAMLAGRLVAWLLWGAGCVLIVSLAANGLTSLVLDAVPVLINLALAWLFGRTLRRGREPLIARMIRLIEGPARLALPGVARYARQLTGFWTIFMLAQALVLAVLLGCATPGGTLDTLGIVPPFKISAGWAMTYAHGGAYAMIVVAFMGEYLFRRIHLRGLPHSGFRHLATQVAARWPQLIRGEDGES